MIVVTGAAGRLGRGVIEGLSARMPRERIVASTRDPGRAAALFERGIAVRRGDFAEPDTLPAAFAGADQVLVVSVDRFGADARRQHRAAIAAARAAGVRRVSYTSHIGARPGSAFADHADAEAALAEHGSGFIALRHGFYAESALHLVGDGFESGEIRAPADGPVSWTARADLAEADAAILAEADGPDGVTPPLVAAEGLTLADIAAIAADLLGRPLRRVVVPDAEWRDGTLAAGVPAPLADALLAMYRAARNGELFAADPALRRLLGRPPRSMRDVLAAVLGARPPPGPGGTGS